MPGVSRPSPVNRHGFWNCRAVGSAVGPRQWAGRRQDGRWADGGPRRGSENRRSAGFEMSQGRRRGGGVAAAPGARPAGGKGHRGTSRPVPASAAGLRSLAAARKIFSKIVLASPSEFPYSTSSHGGVAQLGERLTGSQEVRGSIPLVSTRALNEAPTQVGAFFHIGTQGQRRHHDPPGRQDRKKLRRARPL